MEIRYELQAGDLDAASAHAEARMRERAMPAWRRYVIWAVIVGVLMLNAPLFGKSFGGAGYQAWMWGLTAVVFFGSMLWLARWRRTPRAARWREQFTGSFTLALTRAGLVSTAPGGRVIFRAWPEIVGFETTESYAYLYLRRDVAITVPCGALEDPAAFAEQVRALWGAHPDNAGRALPPVPVAPTMRSPNMLWANLRGGARIAFLRDFSEHRFEVSLFQLSRLMFFELLCLGVLDFVDALPAPQFNAAGLAVLGTDTLLTVAAAACIAAKMVQRATTLRLLVMVAAASLAISLVCLPLYYAAEHLRPNSPRLHWALYLLPALWTLLAVYRIVGRLYRQPAPGALSFVGVFAFFTLALGSLLPSERIYYGADPDAQETAAADEGEKLNVEDVFYAQPALVQRAVAELAPQRPGKTDLYFVGFAGEGSERVFGNEVRFARDLLDRRFGTAGRSLVLLNSPDAADDTPLANPHNLDAALAGVAARMDRKEDVLFVFLSSHGAQDHRLAVSQRPLELNDLAAEDLKTMLDRYGIKNRVIVVSACYSGGFLDVLKDDNTLVLTASSRNHVSYGCGDYTDYTYFGESYFVKALAHGDSFIAAFAEARRLIEEREKKEGQDPSHPQIHVGRNIPAVLQRLAVEPAELPRSGPELHASLP